MNNIRMKGLLAVGVGLLALSAFAPEAWALKVTLKRIVFEGPRRAEVLSIINNTGEEQIYRLSWRQMRMSEDDALVVVKEGDQTATTPSVEPLVRYAPRRIVIPPGGTQQVRLMLTKPQDLAEGEYRSHLWLQPEADITPPAASTAQDEARPQVQLKMLTGMTLPVIVRHGTMSVKATISDARVSRNTEGKGMDVALTVGRQGNRSLYGDFKFTCDGGALAREIKGVAVYTDVTQRHMNFTVPFPAEGACKTLNIQYIADQDDADLKGAVLATAAVAVP